MGKQLRFFLLQEEEETLLNEIFASGGILLDSQAKIIKVEIDMPRQVFICVDKSRISMIGEFVDQRLSEVIIFTRTDYTIRQEVYHGRIWMEPHFYNQEGELCNKSNEINEMYESMRKKIKQRTTRSKCGFAYISDDLRERALNKELLLKASPNVDLVI